jgi:uncharacterized protein with HEPN domain
MYDRSLARSILLQIADALQKIVHRAGRYHSADEFTLTAAGLESLDSICMLFMAVGEAFKNIDKITSGELLARYPQIDWKGVIGFRDIIAHQYFDVDAEQVFWICTHDLQPLSAAVEKMIREMGE